MNLCLRASLASLGALALIAYRRFIQPERPHGPTLMMVETPEPIPQRENPVDLDTLTELAAVR